MCVCVTEASVTVQFMASVENSSSKGVEVLHDDTLKLMVVHLQTILSIHKRFEGMNVVKLYIIYGIEKLK